MLPSIITLASPSWHISDSYGRYALEMFRQMEQAGLSVNTIGGGAPNPYFNLTAVNLLFGYPTNFSRFGKIANFGMKLAFTTWESTCLPPAWIPVLNTCAAVIVPCQWNAVTFRESGVTAPIHVVPHGMSQSFHYVERTEHDVFRFLCIGDRGERKGFIEAMNAFIKVFGSREDVELVIKARSQVIPQPLTNRNIHLIKDDYNDEQMQGLYASTDCFLCPAKAEGFGIPPREVALTGGISICTNYGGMADDIDQWGYGIDYQLVPAWAFHRQYQGLGEWAEIDLDQLAAKMLEVRQMPLAERNRQGRVFSDNVKRLYRWENVAKSALSIVSGLLEQQAEEAYADRRAV